MGSREWALLGTQEEHAVFQLAWRFSFLLLHLPLWPLRMNCKIQRYGISMRGSPLGSIPFESEKRQAFQQPRCAILGLFMALLMAFSWRSLDILAAESKRCSRVGRLCGVQPPGKPIREDTVSCCHTLGRLTIPKRLERLFHFVRINGLVGSERNDTWKRKYSNL